MADLEKVKKALGLCKQNFDCPSECPYLMDCNDLAKPMFVDLARDALELLKEQQQIVRCKDCKHYDELCQQCERIDGIIQPEFFCADGERK